MRNQTIFNKVLKHLRAQGKRSAKNEVCLYRGPNGLKCAVGIFIPNAHYEKDMDKENHNSVRALWHNFEIIRKIFHRDQIGLLDRLQQVHDLHCHWSKKGFVGNWSMQKIARDFGLTYTPKGS